MSARWARQFVVLLGCVAAGGSAPGVAAASPEPGAYLGQQARHTLDGFELADRARLAVNVANGNLVVTFDDVRIAGRGLDLALSRTYNSRTSVAGQYGDNWTSSFGNDNGLEGLPASDQTWRGPTGEEFTFTKQGNGSFTSPPAANAALDNGGGTLTFDRSGVRLQFVQNTSVHKQLSKAIDRNGNEITLTYSGQSLAKITDTQGRELMFAYDAGGNLDSITDPTGRQWLYAHDTSDRLTSYTDPEAKTWTYDYDSSDRLIKITDPRSNQTLIGYDTTDRVTSVTRRVDGTTTNDVKTTYSYPSVTSPCTSGTHSFKTVVTNPRGKATTYCADADRQVTRVRNALNQESTRTYTPNGDVSGFTELAGTGQPPQTTLTHDTSTNNLTGGTMGAGETFSQKYCGDSGEPSCATLGFPTAAFAPTRFVDTEGSDTLFGYDSNGNLTDVKDAPTPRNSATLTYNGDGTVATATDGRGNQTTFSYFTSPANQAGNLKTITPPATSGPGAALGATHFTYDSLGRVQTELDGRGVVTTYTYDKIDRIKSVATSGGGPHVTFAYDGNGNLTQRVSTTAGTTTYNYDKLNRRISESFPGPLTNTYGYDKSSNLIVISDPSGGASYGYDDIDRLSYVIAPAGGTDTVTYTYVDSPTAADPTTKVTATYPGGATQRTDRNGSGQVTGVFVRNNSGTLLASREYDYLDSSTQRGLVQSVTDQAGVKTSYTYEDTTTGEDVGRLLKARAETAGGALVEEHAYEYDEAGNRTRWTRTLPGQTVVSSYAYNEANQLCWRRGGTWSNPCGSPPPSTIKYVYDAAGNQLSGDQGTQSMSYDALGRVSAIGGTTVQSFSDSANELKSFGTRSYHNNLLGLSREWVGSDVTSIARHPHTGLPVSETQPGGKRYFLQDKIGSTIGMLNAASGGSIARSFSYTPAGDDSSTGTGPVTNQRFAGGHRLLNTFMYHFGARFYDVTTGRWTQQDAYLTSDRNAFRGTLWSDLRQSNRYAYAAGDPVNLTDRLGADVWDVQEACAKGTLIGGVSGAAGGAAAGAIFGPGALAGAAAGGIGGAVTGCVAGALEELL